MLELGVYCTKHDRLGPRLVGPASSLPLLPTLPHVDGFLRFRQCGSKGEARVRGSYDSDWHGQPIRRTG